MKSVSPPVKFTAGTSCVDFCLRKRGWEGTVELQEVTFSQIGWGGKKRRGRRCVTWFETAAAHWAATSRLAPFSLCLTIFRRISDGGTIWSDPSCSNVFSTSLAWEESSAVCLQEIFMKNWFRQGTKRDKLKSHESSAATQKTLSSNPAACKMCSSLKWTSNKPGRRMKLF